MPRTLKTKSRIPSLNTRVHTTISGHLIRYTSSEAIDTFLKKLEACIEDQESSEQSMASLIYSSENPIMDTSLYPGHAVVTKKVFSHPAYRIMNDLLFRKVIQVKKMSIEDLAKRFSITLREAARKLRVHPSTLRRAIKDRQLASWIKNRRIYIDESSLLRFKTFRALRKKRK